jgi:hypothetical protein
MAKTGKPDLSPAPMALPTCEDVVRLIEQMEESQLNRLAMYLIDKAASLGPITVQEVKHGVIATGPGSARGNCGLLAKLILMVGGSRTDNIAGAINQYALETAADRRRKLVRRKPHEEIAARDEVILRLHGEGLTPGS